MLLVEELFGAEKLDEGSHNPSDKVTIQLSRIARMMLILVMKACRQTICARMENDIY